MKKKPLAVFVYSQLFSLLTPGFSGIAHAASLSHTHYRRGKQESSALSNELAQTLTTIGQNKQNAPEMLASTYASTALTNVMDKYGHASASINFGDTSGQRGKLTSAEVNFLKPISDKKNNELFYQLSYNQPNASRKIFSAGLGDRHFFNNTLMLGANTFIDADTKDNIRGSVGVELGTDYARLSSNYYQPLSGWKHSSELSYYDTRPARGFDVRFKGYLPNHPEFSTNLAYSKYFGKNVDAFNSGDRMRDPSVLTYGVSYRPMQMLSFHVNHQQEMGGQKQWSGGLSIHYQLGVPLSEQMKPVPEDYGSLDTMRYAFVQRNYTMPLNYKDVAALSVVLNSGTLTDGMTLNPTISSSRGITSVIWTGTLAKYLNSTNTEHPIIQNLPVGITKGTLNVMVEDNSGKTVSATGNFTSTILPTLTAIAKANDETGTAIVSGEATPGASITILFPDGEKRKLTVSPSGQYSATSAKYMSNGNIHVIETINGVTAKKSLAFKQMIKPTFGKAKVTPDSHNDAVIDGKGATPNSKVVIVYPDGSQQTVPTDSKGNYHGQSVKPQPAGNVIIHDESQGKKSQNQTVPFVPTADPGTPSANPNNTNDAVINGKGATPNSTITFTYPDGSQQTVKVNPDGTYQGQSATPQPAGKVTVVDHANGKDSSPVTTPFTPNANAGKLTAKESTDHKDLAVVTGNGATPNSSVTITFPNGEQKTVPTDAKGYYQSTSNSPQPLGKVTAVDSVNGSNGKSSTTDYIPHAAIGSVYSLPSNSGQVRVYTSNMPTYPAIPGSTITITYPDGSTSGAIVVGKNGQYNTVSKNAYMPSGNITITDTVASGNTYTSSIPFTQTHAHAGSAVASPDSDNHAIVNGKGALPGSTVIITYPDGSTSAPIPVDKNGQYHDISTKPQPKGKVKITDEVFNGHDIPTHNETITVPFTPNLTLSITNETNNLAGQAVVTGMTDPNANVTVHFPQGNDVIVQADKTGHFTATSNTAYQPTGKMVSVKAVLGNAVKSVQKLFNKAHSKPVVTEADHSGQVTVTGYGIPGSTVSVTFSDGSIISSPVNRDGTYVCHDPKVFPPSGLISVVDISADHEKSDANTVMFTQTKGPDIAPFMRTPGCGIQGLNNGFFRFRGKTTPGAKV